MTLWYSPALVHPWLVSDSHRWPRPCIDWTLDNPQNGSDWRNHLKVCVNCHSKPTTVMAIHCLCLCCMLNYANSKWNTWNKVTNIIMFKREIFKTSTLHLQVNLQWVHILATVIF
jgi:hypothetical protein